MIAFITLLAALATSSLAAPISDERTELARRGCYPSQPQDWVVDEIYKTCKDRGCSDKVLLTTFETCVIESNCASIPCGDQSSVGPFQQKDFWGSFAERMSPRTSANKFLDLALQIDKEKPWLSAGKLAQAVQRSEANAQYDNVESRARAIIAQARARVGGGGGGAVNVAKTSKPKPKPKPAAAKPKPKPKPKPATNYAKPPKNVAKGTTAKCLEYLLIKSGDTAWAISQRFHTSPKHLLELNGGIHKDFKNIQAGAYYCVRG